MSRPLTSLIGAVAAAGLLHAAPAARAGVATTRHNLSVGGPGTVKAASETQICIFCHAPHNASPSAPLWNRRAPGSTYVPYTSSTTLGNPGQPTGASLLCLSCHDGTIALGEVLSLTSPIAMSGGVTTMPSGPGRLGTDLSDDHPISFVYSAALASARGELVDPAMLTGRVRLDASGQMQCTACHDPHDDSYGKFLVMPNPASALCQTCHLKSFWSQSSHRLSTAAWNGAGPDPWPHTSETTVSANACENCHRPHSAPGRKWILNAASEEDNCYPCHNGNVATKNIQSEFTGKPSRHPVSSASGLHDPVEPAMVQTRHVECVDCHNPHATNAGTATPPGSLAGVRGITIGGTDITPVTAEYQVCFRCHADSPGKPAPHTTRQIAQGNLRLELEPSNPSYHPVASPGKNPNVPSLLSPWTTSSIVRCGHCHNNNTGPGNNGSGPSGPHASVYTPLLERQYVTADRTPESAANYALCYKCHNRNSYIQDGGPFPDHKKHVVEERTPCNVCHDPHGVSATQGNAINNSKLINFDTSVVSPTTVNGVSVLKFESLGPNTGRCYMVCHGKDHRPCNYPGGC